MKKLMAVLMLVMLQGCAIILGRHPDREYMKRYCFPCVESTRNFGFGISVTPNHPSKWQRFAIGWDYDHFWRTFFHR